MTSTLRKLAISVVAFALIGPALAENSPDWGKLVGIGKKHGLPRPGPTARLALIHSESWSVVGNESQPHEPANYEPGWVLEENADGSIRVLVGLHEKTLKPREAREPLWRTFSTEIFKPRIGGYVSNFDSVSTFAVAVQCAARGDLSRAEILWGMFSHGDWMSDGFGRMRYDEGKESPELLFGAMLFDRLELGISEPNVNLGAVKTSMKSLLADFPALADQRRKALLASVSATVAAPTAEAGSVEALLIEYGQDGTEGGCEKSGNDEVESKSKIVRMGFAAIPELLRLESDRRLTARRRPAFMNAPSSPIWLGDLAKEVLGDLLPEAASGGGFFDAPVAGDFTAAWKKVRKEGELAYFTRLALKRGKDGEFLSHQPALAVLSDRWPERLEDLVARFERESGDGDSAWILAEAVLQSGLSREEKLRLVVGLANIGGIARRRMATQALANVDPEAARAPARGLIQNLPGDAEGVYWTNAVASVSHVVLAVDDDIVWQSFFDSAKRAKVGLSLEWMNPFDYTYVGDRLKVRRLGFLAGFLDDTRVRDVKEDPEKFGGPCAAFTFPTISVRDFAAMQIASILKIDPLDSPDATWTKERWTALRAKVRKQLEAERIAPMKGK